MKHTEGLIASSHFRSDNTPTTPPLKRRPRGHASDVPLRAPVVLRVPYVLVPSSSFPLRCCPNVRGPRPSAPGNPSVGHAAGAITAPARERPVGDARALGPSATNAADGDTTTADQGMDMDLSGAAPEAPRAKAAGPQAGEHPQAHPTADAPGRPAVESEEEEEEEDVVVQRPRRTRRPVRVYGNTQYQSKGRHSKGAEAVNVSSEGAADVDVVDISSEGVGRCCRGSCPIGAVLGERVIWFCLWAEDGRRASVAGFGYPTAVEHATGGSWRLTGGS